MPFIFICLIGNGLKSWVAILLTLELIGLELFLQLSIFLFKIRLLFIYQLLPGLTVLLLHFDALQILILVSWLNLGLGSLGEPWVYAIDVINHLSSNRVLRL